MLAWRTTARTQFALPPARLHGLFSCRTWPRVERLNEVAAALLARHGAAPVVDFYAVTAPRSDAAPDNRHYTGVGGVVYQAGNRETINTLCGLWADAPPPPPRNWHAQGADSAAPVAAAGGRGAVGACAALWSAAPLPAGLSCTAVMGAVFCAALAGVGVAWLLVRRRRRAPAAAHGSAGGGGGGGGAPGALAAATAELEIPETHPLMDTAS